MDTPAALPRLVTPNGLSTPRLVAASGPLRADNRLSDTVAIVVSTLKVYIYLDQGDGTAAAPTSFSLNVAGAVPTAIAIGDVTGDGKPDLVVVDAAHNNVLILPGRGDGTFGVPVAYSLGATNVSPGSVAVADLNGDGKPDIVTGNIGSVTVLLNNGSGGFPSPVTSAAPVTATCASGCRATITLGDLNGDNRPDIVTATTLAYDTAQIAVLLNQGNGAFAAAATYAVGSGPIAIAIGDVNGDTKPDLAVANIGDSTASILLNTGTGAFAAQTAYPVGANPMAIALSDRDRDGKLDLVTADRTGSIMTLHGKGDGTFARVALPVGNNPQDVITPVLTGSGRHDLVVANTLDHTLSVLLNNGDGTFTPAAGSPIALGSAPYALAAADFTGDGKMDLAVAMTGAMILPGNGAGGFGPPVALPVPGASFTSIAAADLGNGHPDLLLASTNGTQVRVLLNNGTGTFTAAPGSPITMSAIPHGLVLQDVNGDHIPDLIVGLENQINQTNGSVAVLLGHGDGTFQAAPGSPIVVGEITPGVAIADVNGDGKQDLIILHAINYTANNTVSVLLGNGDGTFGAPVALPNPPGAVNHTFGALTVADLNGDGAPDLAVTDACPGTGCVHLYKGNGDGTFTDAGAYEFGQSASSVNGVENVIRSVDLGGGHPDLVTVGALSQGTPSTAGVVNLLRNRFVPPSAATHLIFSAPMPAALGSGAPFAVVIAAADASGVPVNGFGGAITLSLNGGSGLGGTLTQTADLGNALFLGLAITNPGAGLTLTATSGGLTGTSTIFGVGPSSPLPPPQPTAPVQSGPQPLPPARPTAPVALPTPNPLPPSRP